MKKYISFLLFPFPMLIYMIYKAHHDKIRYKSIYDDVLPSSFDGFRIFFISDIHRRRIKTSTLKSIADSIDIVVIGGDLIEKGVPLSRMKKNLRKLKRWNTPIYFVWGNNDYETDVGKFSSLLHRENVTILANKSTNIRRGNTVISLLGLDCSTYKEVNIDLARKDACGTFQILATHIPGSFYDLDESTQDTINIVLSGHTHGGQMRFFGFGPYAKGSFKKVRNSNVLVSEGYGYTLLPFRIGTNAECHVITLRKQNHKSNVQQS